MDNENEKDKNRNELFRLCVIRNSISLVCFTMLAIVFQNWWIVFWSILFYTFVPDDKKEK